MIAPGPLQWMKLFGHAKDVPLSKVASADVNGPRAAAMQLLHDEEPDGVVGPKTLAVMEGRLCLHPDFGDPEIVEAGPNEVAKVLLGSKSGAMVDIAKTVCCMHERLVGAAIGSGSWPGTCHAERHPRIGGNKYHVITYSLRRNTFPSHYFYAVGEGELQQIVDVGVWGVTREWLFDTWLGKPMLEVAYWLSNEACRLTGTLMIEEADEQYADIIELSRWIPGSTIGLGWFPNGACTDVVEAHYDSGYEPGLHAMAWLRTHEAGGHCRNLQHTFTNQNYHRGVLSYRPKYPFEGFSRGVSPWTLPLDPSIPVLNGYFGSEPAPHHGTDQPDQPDNPVPPDLPMPPRPQPPVPPSPPTPPSPPASNPLLALLNAVLGIFAGLLKNRPIIGIAVIVVAVILVLRSCSGKGEAVPDELPPPKEVSLLDRPWKNWKTVERGEGWSIRLNDKGERRVIVSEIRWRSGFRTVNGRRQWYMEKVK